MKFLKLKKTFFVLFIVLCIGGAIVIKNKGREVEKESVLAAVKSINLINTADYQQKNGYILTNGEVQASSAVAVKAQMAGELKGVYVNIGAKVHNNQVLAEINSELMAIQVKQAQAVVTQAQAGLDLRLADPLPEQIKQAEIAIEQAQQGVVSAKLSLEKVQASNILRVQAANKAVEVAKNNLQLADNNSASYLLIHTYEGLVAQLKNTAVVIEQNLAVVNSVLGVEPTLENSNYAENIGVLDHKKFTEAKDGYINLNNNVFPNLQNRIKNQTINFQLHQTEQVDTMLIDTVNAVAKLENLLVLTREVLDTSLLGGNLTPVTMSQLKLSVDSASMAITRELQSLKGLNKGVTDTNTAYTNLQIAYEQTLESLIDTNKQIEIDEQSAKNGLQAQEITVEQAKAALGLLLADPKPEEIASLQAGIASAQQNVAMAQYNLNQAKIQAPIDGEVTDVLVNFGEYVNPGQTLLTIASTQSLEIKTYINEQEAALMDRQAEIIINDEYVGMLIEKSAVVDPITKKIRLTIYVSDTTNNLTIGEFVRLRISTVTDIEGDEANLYVLPLASVKVTENNAYIAIVNNEGKVEYIEVTLGEIIGEKVKVLSGINAGMQIVANFKNIDKGEEVKINN